MKQILKVDSPNDYARYVGAPSLHPLVGIIHYDELTSLRSSMNSYGVYGLFIQRAFPKQLSYGTKTMQASGGSIIAVAPGQQGGREDDGEQLELSGWVVMWSPELLHNTQLGAVIKDYRFFSYFVTESLRMEPEEWQSITRLVEMLREELVRHPDSPELREVILSYLRLILDYCNRIYLRQLSPDINPSDDILKRFDALLERYFLEGRQLERGLPTVAYCASELAYSSGYFGDLIHQATGRTAISHIHTYVVNQGKNLLMHGHNISETSRLLGFDYPHHFTRLFKKVTGMPPTAYVDGKNGVFSKK